MNEIEITKFELSQTKADSFPECLFASSILAVIFSFVLLAGCYFWHIFYGSLEAVYSVQFSGHQSIGLPLTLSRWWICLVAPLWLFFIFVLLEIFERYYNNDKGEIFNALLWGLLAGLLLNFIPFLLERLLLSAILLIFGFSMFHPLIGLILSLCYSLPIIIIQGPIHGPVAFVVFYAIFLACHIFRRIFHLGIAEGYFFFY